MLTALAIAVTDAHILIKCLVLLDWIVQIKFGLRPDIWSTANLVDQTEFWTDLEDKTERLSPLEKFMQIRTQTEVWGLRTKSDLFYQVTQCIFKINWSHNQQLDTLFFKLFMLAQKTSN